MGNGALFIEHPALPFPQSQADKCVEQKPPAGILSSLDSICIWGMIVQPSHCSGWRALSEAACPVTLPERTVWGPPGPVFNPAVFYLDHRLPLMCICPVDTTLKSLLQEALPSFKCA